MSQPSRLELIKSKAKLLQKAKKKAGLDIQLKEAFEILAKHAGFPSWREMKENLEMSELTRFQGSSAHWNTWYSSYEKAKEHLDKNGGYLLAYQKDFFICDQDYISSLGISADDSDLLLVGNNWMEPQDKEAWERLIKKMKARV